MAETRKEYLGDAVYITVDEYARVVLTTENGIRTTNEIVLEPEVYQQLKAWMARAEARKNR